MRGWIWAGPGRAEPSYNYREDIWDHVGAQMALTAADLQYSTVGLAVVGVCMHVCVSLVYPCCEARWQWPTSNKQTIASGFFSLCHSAAIYTSLQPRSCC